MDIPTYQEFQDYAFERIKSEKDDPYQYTDFIKSKYDAWTLAGWRKESGGKLVKIHIWKTTLIQCLIYRMPNKVKEKTVRAEPIKSTGKMKEIEDEIILSAYANFVDKGELQLKHDECFDFLLERGVFKKGKELSEKTGKPWREWYNKLLPDAIRRTWAYCSTNEDDFVKRRSAIKEGLDPLVHRFLKLVVLETYFKRYQTKVKLKTALNQ